GNMKTERLTLSKSMFDLSNSSPHGHIQRYDSVSSVQSSSASSSQRDSLENSRSLESITLSGDEREQRELGKVCVRLSYQEALEQVWITLLQCKDVYLAQDSSEQQKIGFKGIITMTKPDTVFMETFVFALRLQQLRCSALVLRLQTHHPRKRTVAECVLSLRQLGPEETQHWMELSPPSKTPVSPVPGSIPLNTTLSSGSIPLNTTLSSGSIPLNTTDLWEYPSEHHPVLWEYPSEHHSLSSGSIPLNTTLSSGSIPLNTTLSSGSIPLNTTLSSGSIPLNTTQSLEYPSEHHPVLWEYPSEHHPVLWEYPSEHYSVPGSIVLAPAVPFFLPLSDVLLFLRLRCLMFSSSSVSAFFVKIEMQQLGTVVMEKKTHALKSSGGQLTWTESFYFPLAQDQSFLLSVKLYSRRSVRRKRYLGQVHLGFDSPTQEAAEQWRDSMSHPEKVIAVWHRLNGS
ncbi:unnamed protein product, partial [Coregonus sp. 'balchen']